MDYKVEHAKELIEDAVRNYPRVAVACSFGKGSMVTVHLTKEVEPDTIAKSIAIGNPADGYCALRVAKQSGGGTCAVTDEELIAGMKLLAQTKGIFAEAVGGVVIAGLKKLTASGVIKKNELTVAFITRAVPRTQETVSGIVQHFIPSSLA